MMNLYEIKNKIEEIIIDGEVRIDKEGLYWYFEEDTEDADFMWDVYCENADLIRKAGYETEESWQDNDSCGFTIIL
jgi:hypothetical protein